jgi:Tfp pilus assembly PilM family ATPase
MTIAAEALDFDPYRVWLNITESQRPLSPYQLLAIVPLEADANRIRAGYLRQQSAMLMHADKADPQVWEALNGEIEAAFTLLCDPEQKAVLDAAIRRKAGQGASKAAANGSAHAALGNVTCRQCQKSNPASRRFCGGCGTTLWEQCPQCQAECAADERFCGTCGADILGGLSEQSKQFQAKLAEAQELLAAFRYEAAISTLRGVAAVSDARFEKWAQQALAEIARIEQLRKEQRLAAEGAYARAKRLMDGHAYENVVSELEETPPPLRSPEAAALLDRARSARKELLTLGGEIRAAIEEKRTSELLPKIERLLTLKPGHKQAMLIAEQLRDQMLRGAKKAILAHQYQEALDQLDQVSSLVRSAEVETLTETAGELLALLDGVKGAALADRPTLALADRLVKLAPTNDDAAKLRAQIAERMKSRPADPHFGAPNFSPVPKRTTLGLPIDWLAHPTRLVPKDDLVTSALREHPGQMFVALGLALQGIGQAAIPIDLTPTEKTGMLTMLQGFSLGKKAGAAAWGLDLSDYALKAVKLVRDPKGTAVVVDACEYILHEKPLTHPELDLQRSEIIDRTLRDFLSRAGDLRGTKVAVGFPGHRVLGRFFELPPLAARKVPDAIAYEARHQLPVALEELCWASHLLDVPDGKAADDQPRRVLVTAAREAHVRDRLAAFKDAGIAVDFINSDPVALHNALVYELFSDQQDAPEAICAVDLGTDSTNIVISSPRSIWFRSFGQAGDSFTSVLLKQLTLTHQQAEQVKREPAKARRFGQWRDAVKPVFVQIAGEIERSLANYAKLDANHPVQQIYGLGGAFQTHGLLRHLRFGR